MGGSGKREGGKGEGLQMVSWSRLSILTPKCAFLISETNVLAKTFFGHDKNNQLLDV